MDAAAIAQTYLDEVAAIVMADDWTAFTDVLCRPFTIVTNASTLTYPTPEDLRGVYVDFVAMIRTQHVTDYIRLVESVSHLDPDLISARYVTHLLSSGHRLMDPVKSSIILRREDNRWRAASIINSASNFRWLLLTPELGQDAPGAAAPLPNSSVKGPDHD